ncbi:MAG: FHA domain-containing protein [Pseudomonadota bacterium]
MSGNPVLIAREGQLTGQRWIIEDDEFLIGRGAECQLVLPERQVSRHHVRITPGDSGGYVLHDLGSKNGTHINGKRISGSVPLSDGDTIQVALSVTLMFVGTEATLPLTWEAPKPEKLLMLEEEKRTAIAHGKELDPPLSLAQFRLMKLLFDADGSVVDRDSIIHVVWPDTEGIGVSEQAIDALMRRLRDRLVELDEHNFIVTVRGHGFRLDNPMSS